MNSNHLLFIFRTLGTGGAQKIQAFVANACVKYGYNVSIITMSRDKPTINLDSSIPIYVLDYTSVINSKNALIKFLMKARYLFQFRSLCKKINPDMLVVFLIDIVRLTTVALKGLSYPIIGSERADPSQFDKKKIDAYSRALNKCRAVVFQLEKAASYYNLNSNLLKEVIPNPSSLRTDSSGTIKISEEFIFGAGRLVSQKRFDVLIKAYNLVQKKYPQYKLRLYGDGAEKRTLLKLVNELELNDNVVFMGDVNDVFSEINNTSIFVLSSDYEGIPNVITEALLNGIPTISTDCSPGGARFLLDNGRCGIITRTNDHEQLAKAIIYYIENPLIANRKVEYSKFYLKSFDPIIIERKWITLIERSFDR